MKDGVYYMQYWWSLPQFNLDYIYVMGYNLEPVNNRYNQVFNASSMNLTDGSISATYSPADDTVYCLSLIRNAEGVALSKLILGSGSISVDKIVDLLGSLNDYESIAADASGQLYCITKTWNGSGDGAVCTGTTLNKMDKNSGALTQIGSMGVLAQYRGSATIDLGSGEMYWSVADADNAGYLAKVNLANGQVTKIYDYPYNEGFVGLASKAVMPERFIPGQPSALDMSFEGLSLSGTISFTTPSTYASGKAGEGTLTYHVKTNDVELATGEASYGERVTANITVDKPGNYKFVVYCSSEDGDGEPRNGFIYLGPGLPLAPDNQKAEYVGGGDILVSWAMVNNTVDGTIDPDNVVYKVIRVTNGEETEVFSGKQTYKYYDHVGYPEQSQTYYYKLTATYEGLESDVSETGMVTLGRASLPYVNDFETMAAFNELTVINTTRNTETWLWWPITKSAYIGEDYSDPKDDWFMLPAMYMEAGYSYQVSVDAWVKSGSYPEKLEVKYGSVDLPAQMTGTLVAPQTLTNQEAVTLTGTITPETSGLMFIGVHAISDADMWELYVDNIKVSAGVQASVPAGAEELTAEAQGNELKALVSFKAPTLSASGGKLTEISKAELYRGEDLIHTFNSVEPGAQLSYLDEEAANGINVYKVLLYNETGASAPVETSVFCGVSYPQAPAGVNVKETANLGEVTLTWDAVDKDVDDRSLASSPVTYNIYVTDGYDEPTLVASGIEGTTHTFRFVEEGRQEFLLAKVCAETPMGEGQGKFTDLVPVGTPYDGYHESAPDGEYDTLLGVNTAGGASWAVLTEASGPYSYDGDNGFFACSGNSNGQWADLKSGKISLKNFRNPGLFFYVYPLTNANYNNVENEIEVYAGEAGGETKLVYSTSIKDLGQDLGWKRINVPLTEFEGKDIVFSVRGVIRSHVYTIVDNFNVGMLNPFDVALVDVTAPRSARTGSEFNITAHVENTGYHPALDLKVRLYADDTQLAEESFAELPAGTSCNVTLTHKFHALASDPVDYRVEVDYAEDMYTDDNTATVTVEPHYSNMPVVTDLTGEASNEGYALLEWSEPDLNSAIPEQVEESFETAPAFAKEYGKWKFIDRDEKPSKLFDGIENITFPGISRGDKTSFFIYNDSEFGSSMWAMTGNQCLVSLPARDGTATDDWAISPLLSGEPAILSFFAKGSSPFYPEKIQVLVSKTGSEPEDFELLEEINLNEAWTRAVYWLESGVKYFAIRNVVENGLFLMVDDLLYTPAIEASDLDLLGYNIYRDGEQINDELVTEPSYQDHSIVGEPAGSEHLYRVTAQFAQGESRGSNGVQIITSSVADVKAGIEVMLCAGGLRIVGAEGKTVNVFDASGVNVAAMVCGDDTFIALPAGIYIVKVSDTVAKVNVR